MNHDHGQNHNSSKSIWKFVFIGFALVAGFFLVTEHRAHLFGILPFLLLAACPLMHFFGHGRGGHAKEESKPEQGVSNKKPEPPEHQHH